MWLLLTSNRFHPTMSLDAPAITCHKICELPGQLQESLGECPQECPRKRGVSTGVSDGVSPGCPKSVPRVSPECPGHLFHTPGTLSGHFLDTPEPGPRGHPVRHSLGQPPFSGTLLGTRDSCSWPGSSQHKMLEFVMTSFGCPLPTKALETGSKVLKFHLLASIWLNSGIPQEKPLNLIKSPIFTNAPCKSTCLYNTPSMHTLDFNT